MAFVIPDHHKHDLRAALDAQGWSVEDIEPPTADWWINALWRIQSRWRPVGAEAFITFIGDQGDGHTPPRRVGDVAIGLAPAESVLSTNVTRFALHPDWPSQRDLIVAHAAKLRELSLAEEQSTTTP